MLGFFNLGKAKGFILGKDVTYLSFQKYFLNRFSWKEEEIDRLEHNYERNAENRKTALTHIELIKAYILRGYDLRQNPRDLFILLQANSLKAAKYFISQAMKSGKWESFKEFLKDSEFQQAKIITNLEKDDLTDLNNAINYYRPTLLRIAAESGNIELLKYIVSLLDLKEFKNILGLALLEVARRGNLKMLKYLVSIGGDPNFHNYRMLNSISIAYKEGNLELLRYLVSLGIKTLNGDNDILKAASSSAYLGKTEAYIREMNNCIKFLTSTSENKVPFPINDHRIKEYMNDELIKYIKRYSLDKNKANRQFLRVLGIKDFLKNI